MHTLRLSIHLVFHLKTCTFSPHNTYTKNCIGLNVFGEICSEKSFNTTVKGYKTSLTFRLNYSSFHKRTTNIIELN